MSTAGYKLNFDEIKAAVSMEQVVTYLGIVGLKRIAKNKFRGACPLCKSSDAFSITTDAGRGGTGAFNCFRCSNGGDQLELVSLIRGNARKDPQGLYAAAKELHDRFIAGDARPENGSNGSPQPQQARTTERGKGFDAESYVAKLDPEHEDLRALGIDAATFRDWRAGYCKTGVHRGKLALPVTRDGAIVGFIGRTIKDEPPLLTFFDGFKPENYVFGEDRVVEGELFLVREPIDVLRAYENGETNVICLLTQTISPIQLEMLAALMDKRHCEAVQF